jgi:hypothetical protein
VSMLRQARGFPKSRDRREWLSLRVRKTPALPPDGDLRVKPVQRINGNAPNFLEEIVSPDLQRADGIPALRRVAEVIVPFFVVGLRDKKAQGFFVTLNHLLKRLGGYCLGHKKESIKHPLLESIPCNRFFLGRQDLCLGQERRVIIEVGFAEAAGGYAKPGGKEMSRRRWHCPNCMPGKPCAKCQEIGMTHSMMLNECAWCGRRCFCYESCGCWICGCEQMNMYDDPFCSACGRPGFKVQ